MMLTAQAMAMAIISPSMRNVTTPEAVLNPCDLVIDDTWDWNSIPAGLTDFNVAVSFALILSPVLRTEMSPNFFMLKIAASVLFDTCAHIWCKLQSKCFRACTSVQEHSARTIFENNVLWAVFTMEALEITLNSRVLVLIILWAPALIPFACKSKPWLADGKNSKKFQKWTKPELLQRHQSPPSWSKVLLTAISTYKEHVN